MEAFEHQKSRRREGGKRTSSLICCRDDEDPNTSNCRRSNRTIRSAALPVAALLLGLAALTAPQTSVPAAGQGPLAIGFDASVDGNGPITLGVIDPCVSVTRGDVFDVDLYIQEVDELLAWEVYIAYDPDVLEVTGRDTEMFLAANPGSSVLDVSGSIHNRDGLYRAAAADTSDPPTPDSGSGTLLRLSLKALRSGTSDLELIKRDIDGDGRIDLGPLLRNVDADPLGDTNGDAIFDGSIENAQVAVDTPCDDEAPGPTLDATDGSGGLSTALIAAIAVAGAAVTLIAGFAAFRLFRRSRAESG